MVNSSVPNSSVPLRKITRERMKNRFNRGFPSLPFPGVRERMGTDGNGWERMKLETQSEGVGMDRSKWVVMDAGTGTWDGVYTRKDVADWMLKHFRRTHPCGQWSVVRSDLCSLNPALFHTKVSKD